jgi:2,3-dihydroxybiphenyl 1,2-dioxygenase
MRHDLELAYLGVEVTDPDALGVFLSDTIGLIAGDRPTSGPDHRDPDHDVTDHDAIDGVVSTWRNDDRIHRVVVTAGPADDATVVGFEATTDDAFDDVVARLTGAGFATHPGSPADIAARGVTRMVRTTAPWGIEVEVVTALAHADQTFTSPHVSGGFVTEGVGLGHVVFATTAFDESCRFAIDGLGMRRSDWLEMELAPGINLEVWFFHCNERHHTLALARAPFDLPQCLHHIMFETRERDDVGAAFDRAWASDLPIPNGLGRHDNDGMFSFYVQSPAGFQVEVGHGARVVGDDWDDDRRYDRISAWGHQPLRQP